MLKITNGSYADAGQLDDSDYLEGIIVGGPHDGHTAIVETAKHNCGAWYEDIECSCGSKWGNAVYGCWQYGHQRDEFGDKSLEKATRQQETQEV